MTTPALPDWRPRKTLIDLYNEKNDTPWYYRLGATVSAMMLAVGFFIFASAFVQSYHSMATPTFSLVSALVLLIFAYGIFASVAVFSKSWVFQLDILYIPHLSSSILGLISFIYVLSGHNGALDAMSLSAQFAIFALVLSVVSIVAYSILSVLVLRKINIVRARDAFYRDIPQDKTPGLLREDEEQRQQLSRLLRQTNENRLISPGTATQTTFKIDWPGQSKAQSQRSSFAARGELGTSTIDFSKRTHRRSSAHQRTSFERLPSIRVEAPSGFLSWFDSSRSTSLYSLDPSPPTDDIDPAPTPPHSHSHSHSQIQIHPQPLPLPQPNPRSSPRPVRALTPQPSLSTTNLPAPLKPIAYTPPLPTATGQTQLARYFGLWDSPTQSSSQPGTPQSALPSYSAGAHPSLALAAGGRRPLSRAGWGGNGYWEEKKERWEGGREDSRGAVAVEGEVEGEVPGLVRGGRPRREGFYRMAGTE